MSIATGPRATGHRARVEGSFQLLSGNATPLTCFNLSKGGLCFLTPHRPRPGALIEVSLDLPLPHGAVSLIGRVVQVSESGSGGCLVGCRILDIDPEDRRRLDAHLRQVASDSPPPGSAARDVEPPVDRSA